MSFGMTHLLFSFMSSSSASRKVREHERLPLNRRLRCGIFGTDRRNSAGPLSGGGERVKTSVFSEIPAPSGWRSSCPYE